MKPFLPILLVTVLGARNSIPSIGCQQVLNPVLMQRDIKCGISESYTKQNPYTIFAFTSYLADAEYITSNNDQLERYCSDRCWEAKVNFTNMFANDACKDDVFEIGGVNITASLLSQTPILKDGGYCRMVDNQYCAATDSSIYRYNDMDFFTAQNKSFTCIDCKKPYSPYANDISLGDYSSKESTKTLYDYKRICGSSALGMDIWTVNLVVLLIYLGL